MRLSTHDGENRVTSTERKSPMHLFSSPILRWDKPFIRKLLVVCLPIVIQNLLSASLNIIDGVMIGQLGDAPYAAVTQATRYVFVFQLFLFGAGSGCSIFFSQHWGTKDVPAMRRVMGLCFRIGLTLAALFCGFALAAPETAVGIFLPRGESFDYALQYLTMVAPGFFLIAIDNVYSTCMKASGLSRREFQNKTGANSKTTDYTQNMQKSPLPQKALSLYKSHTKGISFREISRIG